MPPELAQLGLAGLIIFVMSGVIVKQESDKKTLYNTINDIQETRIQDARDTRDKLGDQMEINNKTMGLIYDKLRDSKQGT